MSLAGVEVGAEIEISVADVEEVERGPMSGPATRLHLEWEASRHPRLFPIMTGTLAAYRLTATSARQSPAWCDGKGAREPSGEGRGVFPESA